MKMNEWKLNQRLKIERTLNFSTIPQEEDDLCYSRRKVARDPMSHRIIEKRRRDRMNNCLADLSRLIPHQYMKKSRGRIEKTEIIEMAIKHLKHLQAHTCKDLANCEVAKASEQEWQHQYRLGFQECTSEAVRFLVESEGPFPSEGVCFRLLAHLQEHYDKITRGCYTNGRVGPQLAIDDSNNTQMEMDSSNGHNGTSIEGFNVAAVKRTSSPLSYEPTATSASHQQPQHPQIGDNSQEDVNMPTSASQLREMLQNPNVPIERVRSNSTSSTASSYSCRPCAPIYDAYSKGQTCEEVYKFKNNIKERFNADLHQLVDDKCSLNNSNSNSTFSSPVTKCGNVTVDTQRNNNELSAKMEGDLNCVNSQNDPQTDSSNGSSSPVSNGRSNGSSSGYSTSGDTPNKIKQSRSESPEPGSYSRRSSFGGRSSPYLKPASIPIFALHPKGNFYIPLSLESSFLAPYMHNVDRNHAVLHPVSISVNFCSPVSFSTPDHLTWHTQHSTQSQSCVYDRYRDHNY